MTGTYFVDSVVDSVAPIANVRRYSKKDTTGHFIKKQPTRLNPKNKEKLWQKAKKGQTGTASYRPELLHHHVNVIINGVIYPVSVTVHNGLTNVMKCLDFNKPSRVNDAHTNPSFLAVSVDEESRNKLPHLKISDRVDFSSQH